MAENELRRPTDRADRVAQKPVRERRSFEQVLAEGQLPAAKGTLYTVPDNWKAIVKFFRVYNTSGGAEDVTIWAKPGSASRGIYKNAALAALTVGKVLDAGDELVLFPGDLIEGDATNATVVDYLITGRLEPI